MDVHLQLDLLGRASAAVALGAVIGVERELRSHPAGMRTHALVSLGAAVFTLSGAYGFGDLPHASDPTRVAAQVASGIGFIGAGAILRRGREVSGLTTAATLWLAAAVGVCSAADELLLGAGITALAMVVVMAGRRWSAHLRGRSRRVVSVRYELGHGTLSSILVILGAQGRVGRITVDDHTTVDGAHTRQLDVEVESLSPKELTDAIEKLLLIDEVISVNAEDSEE